MNTNDPTLHHRLSNLIKIAKINEKKQKSLQEYEISLFNNEGLEHLLKLILIKYKIHFKLTSVTLLLLDEKYEFRRFLSHYEREQEWRHFLLFTEEKSDIERHCADIKTPYLGQYMLAIHSILFPKALGLQTVALLPLTRKGKLIGVLNLGSDNLTRFQPNMGTLFLEHLAAVISACIENAYLRETIKRTGLLDPLTGVNNRRFFDQRVVEEVSLAQRKGLALSCLFIDIDHFKQVNDNYGHQNGDLILKKVASLMSENVRTNDILARFGGEEFILLLACTNSKVAIQIAEKIRRRIESNLFHLSDNLQINITLSIGVSTLGPDSPINTAEQLVNCADNAVYQAKKAGRNRVESVLDPTAAQ